MMPNTSSPAAIEWTQDRLVVLPLEVALVDLLTELERAPDDLSLAPVEDTFRNRPRWSYFLYDLLVAFSTRTFASVSMWGTAVPGRGPYPTLYLTPFGIANVSNRKRLEIADLTDWFHRDRRDLLRPMKRVMEAGVTSTSALFEQLYQSLTDSENDDTPPHTPPHLLLGLGTEPACNDPVHAPLIRPRLLPEAQEARGPRPAEARLP